MVMRSYLDYNATAPLRPEAKTAMLAALDACGNASSIHAEGRQARSIIDGARRDVASLVGVGADNVIFTSGGTEANALALLGSIDEAAKSGARISRLIISAIEHESVRANAAFCEETKPGLRVAVCPVTAQGQVDLEALRRLLMEGKGRALVSVMAVNNETGVVQPIKGAVALSRAHGALVHCDAVQAAGRTPISFDHWDVDYLSLSAHKIGGPQGAGALVVRNGVPLASQMRGGSQEFGRRAGTENVAGLAGFGAAAKAAAAELASVKAWAARRDSMERRLREAGAVVFGGEVERVANTVCVAVSGISAATMVIALDLDGFAVSAGSACSSGKVSQSHALAAMGVDPELAACAIRISFGWHTGDEELTAFAEAWARIVSRARSRVAA